jgi:hypothetical protein
MNRTMDCERRLIIVLLMLCAMVLVQSAALSTQNASHHSGDHCCLLCHVGPLPFVETSVAAAAVPVLPVTRVVPAAKFQDAHDVLLPTRSSRAPPV